MILRLRLLDKKSGAVIKVEKIAFHEGKPWVINDYVAKGYETQVLFEDVTTGNSHWEPVDLVFEEGA
jgi:hypothetical protein